MSLLSKRVWVWTVAIGLGMILSAAATSARNPGAPVAAGPKRPFPRHVAYAAGTLRPNGPGRSQAEQDGHVRAFYDRWKKLYVAPAAPRGGKATYRIRFARESLECVSEGQGYGMLIVALMAGHEPQAQALFDGMWRFVRAHPSTLDDRLMDFHVPADEQPECSGKNDCDDDSAFDGDCDIAYALLLADAQWGSAGPVDYAVEARTLLDAILASTIGPNSRLPLLGDWVDPAGRKINEWTPRSSDFMPGHFRAFGRFTGDPVWDQVIAACRRDIDALQAKQARKSGFLPDFIVGKAAPARVPKPAPANFLESTTDGAYSYNACRDPWRLGTDALLNDDAGSRAETQKMSTFIERAARGNPEKIRAGYSLNGKPLKRSKYTTNAFVAPFGVAAMTVPAQQEWLNSLYELIRQGDEEYYEDTLALLSLLVMTGNFWDPTAP